MVCRKTAYGSKPEVDRLRVITMNRNRFLIMIGVLTAVCCLLLVFYNFYTMPPYGPAVLQVNNSAVPSSGGSHTSSAASKAESVVSEESEPNAAPPGISSSGALPAAQVSGSSLAPIHLNTATAAQLEALPSIGPTLAQRIVDYRTQNGPFTTIDELDNVKGIGPATIDKLRNYLIVP